MSTTHIHERAKHLLWCERDSDRTFDACRCRQQTYIICAIIAFVVFIVEFNGARIAQSAGLHADAFHVISHTGMLTLAYLATAVPAHKQKINQLSGVALMLIGSWLAYSGVQRMTHQQWVVDPWTLLVVAFIGLVANAFMFTLFSRVRDEHDHGHTSHMSELLHLIGDIIASGVVVFTAVLLIAWPDNTAINYLDPLCGIGIGCWLAWHGLKAQRGNAHIH